MSTEFRFFDFEAVEPRDGGASIVRGVMPYGAEARIGATFSEVIRAGAFTLGDGDGDVILNLHHDRAQPLARTGGGLTVTDGPAALRIEAEIPAYRGDVVDMLKRRIIRGLSVEMIVDEESWTGDRREVIKARLPGLALVDRPAYTGASAELAARAKHPTPWPSLVL